MARRRRADQQGTRIVQPEQRRHRRLAHLAAGRLRVHQRQHGGERLAVPGVRPDGAGCPGAGPVGAGRPLPCLGADDARGAQRAVLRLVHQRVLRRGGHYPPGPARQPVRRGARCGPRRGAAADRRLAGEQHRRSRPGQRERGRLADRGAVPRRPGRCRVGHHDQPARGVMAVDDGDLGGDPDPRSATRGRPRRRT